MYIPPAFALEDGDKMREVMQSSSASRFCLSRRSEGVPFASHLPLLLDEDRGPHGTPGHMAKPTNSGKHFSDDTQHLLSFRAHATFTLWYKLNSLFPRGISDVTPTERRAFCTTKETSRRALQRLIQAYEG
jgi:predicted FMN-binding regulatory protein PaiB